MRRAYEFLACSDQFIASRTTKSNLDSEEHEDLTSNHQQENESNEVETEGEADGDQSESDDDTTKSPSVTAASNLTKKDSKREIFKEKSQLFTGMKKESLEIWKLRKQELAVLKSLQESIMSKKREK